jgi:hypothetical protein
LRQSEGMRHRDLTVRVYGPFSDTRYATLALKIGSHIVAMGLTGHAVLVPDETITAADVETAARRLNHAAHDIS